MPSVVRCVFLVQFSRLYRLVAIAELRVCTINDIIIEFAFQAMYVPNLGRIPRRTCDLTYGPLSMAPCGEGATQPL